MRVKLWNGNILKVFIQFYLYYHDSPKNYESDETTTRNFSEVSLIDDGKDGEDGEVGEDAPGRDGHSFFFVEKGVVQKKNDGLKSCHFLKTIDLKSLERT